MATVQIEFDVEMKTRDGTILRADIFRPASGEPVPAIVARTPYDKVVRRSHFQHFPASFAAEHGFAVVWQDVRGRFASEGAFSVLNTEVETADGCDCIEWVADQPWCDGNVGMIGVSYESWLMFCAAAAAPRASRPSRRSARGRTVPAC